MENLFEKNNNKIPPPVPPDDLSFQLMPQENPQQNNLDYSSSVSLGNDDEPQFNQRKIIFIIVGALLLIAVIVGAYFVVKSMKKPPEPIVPEARLPKVWLKQYFNKEVCDQKEICGEQADPDKDGLGNYEEFKDGANPINPDTDSDGLADGDEVNIYKTDPMLKFTDRTEVATTNNYTDGLSIKNNYDPLTPRLKMTQTRLDQIAKDIASFGLHEPTITTFKVN